MASARDDEDDPEDDMAGRAQQQGTRKRAKGRGQVAQKKGENEEKDTLCEGGAEGERGGRGTGQEGSAREKTREASKHDKAGLGVGGHWEEGTRGGRTATGKRSRESERSARTSLARVGGESDQAPVKTVSGST